MMTNLLRGALDILDISAVILRGGPGSGHFGHEGRPGERGGSAPSGGQATGENPPNFNRATGMYKFKAVYGRRTRLSKWLKLHVGPDQKDIDRVMPGIKRDYLERAQPWQIASLEIEASDIGKIPETVGATEMKALLGKADNMELGEEPASFQPGGPRQHKGWAIEKVGGHITIGRFVATAPDGRWFWMERLRDVKTSIDEIEKDASNFDKISDVHKKPLYS